MMRMTNRFAGNKAKVFGRWSVSDAFWKEGEERLYISRRLETQQHLVVHLTQDRMQQRIVGKKIEEASTAKRCSTIFDFVPLFIPWPLAI
jgi:hypothetical protein